MAQRSSANSSSAYSIEGLLAESKHPGSEEGVSKGRGRMHEDADSKMGAILPNLKGKCQQQFALYLLYLQQQRQQQMQQQALMNLHGRC